MSPPWEKYAQAPGPWAKYASAATEGGVQDWEPSQQPTEPTVGERINRGVNWLGTRITKAGTAMAGTPRVVSGAIDMLPEGVRKAFPVLEIPRAVGGVLPSKEQMDDFVFRDLQVPEVNSSGRVGKIVDAGVEAAIPTVIMPGSVARNALPAFVGGAASEAAGQVTEGSRWEPVARIGAALGAGLTAAGIQNVLGNVAQGVRNVLAPNVKESAAKIIARNIERDRTTGNALADAQRASPGSMLVENAGPNVRGALRGSTAAPGAARTTAQDAFDARIEGTNTRTTNALDRSVSPNSSLAGTVDDLSALRAQQATPLYERAGIPDRPEMVSPERTVRFAIDEPPVTIPAEYNMPNFSSPKLEALIRDSADVRAAIGAARRLPDYKNLPTNSMSMLDKAYKHLNGLEQEARRAGNGTRVNDLQNLRRDFKDALVEVNPRYGRALEAYESPSKLIGAAERSKEWFTKNVDPVMVRREFEAMSPDEQQSALIGIRDWARSTIGKSDRGTAAERVWAGGNNRERLQAVLGPDAFKKLQGVMEAEKNLIKTQRDVGVGSRTTPMAFEASDNALESVGPFTDLLRGNVLSAAGKFGGRVAGRVAEGRTEATNAEIARMLTSTDPAQVGLVAALLEQARLQELARSGARVNALTYGGAVAPTVNALSGTR